MPSDWLAALEATTLATWVRESGSLWGYPLILTLHTVGLALLVGSSVVLDLRLLGFATSVPLSALEPLFTLMWSGFAVNAGSGLLLFISDASSKAAQPVFWIKLACIAVGVITIRLLRNWVSREGDAATAANVSPRARRLAAVSLATWAGAITAGRLMAYL